MHLTQLPGSYAICRAAPDAPLPPGILDGPGFRTVSRTADELSVVAPEADIAGMDKVGMDKVDTGWTALKLHGPFAFDEVGIVAGLSAALAARGIGIFVISTFDTDYILVKAASAGAAATAWRAGGHQVDLDQLDTA